MNVWIIRNNKKCIKSDFWSPIRKYDKRLSQFEAMAKHYGFEQSAIDYLEFGVASAQSFKWWLTKNQNPDSSFHGFDTFEGLPEAWGGFYGKNAMAFPLPDIEDQRALFYKGLFQETLNQFINDNKVMLESERTKLIHLDADLFSATIFVLSQLYPFLKKGDVIMFDEFNAANHEFKAFDIFTKSFYIDMEPRFACNNFYQTAFEIV